MRLIRLSADYIGEIISGKREIGEPRLASSALTIGSFDGLHRGHWELIRRVRRARDDQGLAAGVVFTFLQHPRQLLAPHTEPFLLTAWRAKLSLLHTADCQVIVAADFCPALAQLPYQDFVETFLVRYLGMKHLVVGYDVHLGADRGGDATTLAALGNRLGYGFELVPPVTEDGEVISSSRIRATLAAGDLDLTARMLGRPYAMWGEVVPGDQRGAEIGFPTANIQPLETMKALPERGVYAVQVQVPGDVVTPNCGRVLETRTEALPEVDMQGEMLSAASADWAVFGGMLNFGRVPTFHGDGLPAPRLEAHIFDFDGDLRGRNVKIKFIKRLRPERKFAGVTELIDQLHQDEAAARAALGMATS